jgi:hypothetical protein
MVTISQQVWAKENLNTERFRNDDLIPEAKTNEEWKKAGITFTKKYNGKTLEIQVEYEDFTTQKPPFITVDFIKNKIREKVINYQGEIKMEKQRPTIIGVRGKQIKQQTK